MTRRNPRPQGPYQPRGDRRQWLLDAEAKWGPHRFKPKSGYRYDWGGAFATYPSPTGVMYMCLWCGKNQRGIGHNHNHRAGCPVTETT